MAIGVCARFQVGLLSRQPLDRYGVVLEDLHGLRHRTDLAGMLEERHRDGTVAFRKTRHRRGHGAERSHHSTNHHEVEESEGRDRRDGEQDVVGEQKIVGRRTQLRRFTLGAPVHHAAEIRDRIHDDGLVLIVFGIEHQAPGRAEILGRDRLHRVVLCLDQSVRVLLGKFDEIEFALRRAQLFETRHHTVARLRLLHLTPVIVVMFLVAELDVPPRLIGEVVGRIAEIVAELLEFGLQITCADRAVEAKVGHIRQKAGPGEEHRQPSHDHGRHNLELHL